MQVMPPPFRNAKWSLIVRYCYCQRVTDDADVVFAEGRLLAIPPPTRRRAMKRDDIIAGAAIRLDEMRDVEACAPDAY